MMFLDFAFLKQRADVVDESTLMPILVIKDDTTKMTSWVALEDKSDSMYNRNKLVDFIRMIGHRRIYLKSDNEAAILALKRYARDTCKEIEL